MQGKKQYQEKLFVSFQLSDHVPEDNFYRRLKSVVDFEFLYKATSAYYGHEGQKSIDPVVFMKMMLVGYLENINSDRRIVSTASLRLDILYFLGYNLDEALPWHSTLSRTRQLYGQEIFLEVFRGVLKQCIDKGMVSGRRQAVDGVYVKANASLDSLIEGEILSDATDYSNELDANQEDPRPPVVSMGKANAGAELPAKKKPSNKTHYSASDPEAKMSVKPGKVTALNYLGQVSVDTASHVITHIESFQADLRDSQCLPVVLEHLVETLGQNHLQLEEVIADTGYSSGEALKALERHQIIGYIPNRSQFIAERPGFIYNSEDNTYTCPNNKILLYKGTFEMSPGAYNNLYRADRKDCNNCPLNVSCLAYGKRGSLISETADKPYYQRMHSRMQTKKARILMKKRQSTVEPVIGTLVNYLGMKKINAKGLKQANKCMTLSATAYNLKKLLRHKTMLAASQVQALKKSIQKRFCSLLNILTLNSHTLAKTI